jgi:hypothetical protein
MIRRLALRRLISWLLLGAVSAAAISWHRHALPKYPHLQYLTGWGTFALMVFLTAYNARKKLPFLPLLSSRVWLQLHLYIGMFTGVAFLLHIEWRWVTGPFEILLTVLFAGVTFSGIFGWWLSRIMPKRLTTAGGEVPFERIPVVRRDLRQQAEALVLTTIPANKSATLATFYTGRLAAFFAAHANFGAHVVGSRRPLTQLLAEFTEVKRFLNPAEKTTAEQLADLVRQKDALDFQRTGQLLLRSWLFVHIPLTYGLLLFSLVHIVLVYSYSGGAR